MGQLIEPKSTSIEDPRPASLINGHAQSLSEPLSEPILTVIIPVYNEAKTIVQLLFCVLAAPYSKQVIVVDDGSTDETAKELAIWRENPQVEILKHPTNRGKGAAIRTGLERARGKYAIIQDGDLEYDPKDFPLLIEPLISGEAQVVYGSRYLEKKMLKTQGRRFLCFGISILNLCVRLLYGAKLTDEATCYKAFSTDLLRNMHLQCERFEFCPEVTAKACRMGLKIKEVPIYYEARTIQAGKKIRWTDGFEALKVLWRLRKWRQDHE
jgi:dolichol-phosphate mannosyltransferase